MARLGREANDPIDELLYAAHAYASSDTPSIVGFLAWFDAGDGELKREAGKADGLVRVMTVHGSKGLQAPIVILADATGNPDSSPVRGVSLMDGDRSIPVPDLAGHEKIAALSDQEEQAKAEERQEHWRLLYVAMTRAEEALFIGGALGGYIAQHFGDNAVFAACTGLILIWLVVANSMNFPQRRPVAAATQTA